MFHEILIPITVAAIPCIGILVSKKFELASQSKGKIYERIEAIEKRVGDNELKFERMSGRLNGMEKK